MKLAIDVHYTQTALAAGVLFADWISGEIERTVLTEIIQIAPYEPGSFYKRELPCILSLLKKVHEPLDVIIIDGYVQLGKAQKMGLGLHLYQALDEKIPIIGVAKKAFKDTPQACELLRGNSINPLYITSAGIELDKAQEYIKQMHGKHRIPTLLKKVDQLCRRGL